MKKTILLFTTLVTMISMANNEFSFNNYKPNTTIEYNISDKKIQAKASIPNIDSDDLIARRINRTLSSFQNSNKNANISYDIVSENAQVLSILFKVEEDGNIEYVPFNFDMTTGKQFKLSDLFQKGYEDPMKIAISDRIRQIGLPLIDKFSGTNDRTKFIFYPDSIEFIFDKGQATTFGDKLVFVPFSINELKGILK